jgi:hypothetical protein
VVDCDFPEPFAFGAAAPEFCGGADLFASGDCAALLVDCALDCGGFGRCVLSPVDWPCA